MAVLTAVLTMAGLADGSMWALLVAVFTAVAVANIYIINKAANLLSDEEWWKSRIRVLELQQQAADMERALHASAQGQRPPLAALPPPDNVTAE
jgi:hypothetical protein